MRCLLISPLLAAGLLAFSAPADGQVSVSGRAWSDLDGDGIQDPAEPGLRGVRVRLLDDQGRELGPSLRTDALGEYRFDGLAASRYRASFRRRDGTRLSPTAVGGLDAGGQPVDHRSRADDSDVNVHNLALAPGARGDLATGASYHELTRLDAEGRPWPLNFWMFHPAVEAVGSPPLSIGDLHRNDPTDLQNAFAVAKWALTVDPSFLDVDDPARAAEGVGAREGAAVHPEGALPVVILHTGWYGQGPHMADLADLLASRGYFCVVPETIAIHSCIALGSRLQRHGGLYRQEDFAHIPQIDGGALDALVAHGYDPDGFLTSRPSISPAEGTAILDADTGFLLDHLAALDADPQHELFGRLDLDEVAWVGFSRGAGFASPTVENEPRIDVFVNIDSASPPNTSKPALYLGKSGDNQGGGTALSIEFSGDQHELYITPPGLVYRVDPFPTRPHTQFHTTFRDRQISAFLDLYLRSINQPRRTLGIDGEVDSLGGYVGPGLGRRLPHWITAAQDLSTGESTEFDAGFVPVRALGFDRGSAELFVLRMDFLAPGTDLGTEHLESLGAIEWTDASGRVRRVNALDALAVDGHGRALLAVRSTAQGVGEPSLLSLDLDDLVQGGPQPAEALARLTLPQILAMDVQPGTGGLFALHRRPGGAPALALLDAEDGSTRAILGPLEGRGERCEDPRALSFTHDGRLLVVDHFDAHLYELSPLDGRILAVLDDALDDVLPGMELAALSWNETDDRAFFVDVPTHSLGSIDLNSGEQQLLGDLSTLGLSAPSELAFLPPVRADAGPRCWARSGSSRSTLGTRRLFPETPGLESGNQLAGGRIELWFSAGSARPDQHRLRVATSATVREGAERELHAPDPRHRHGVELWVDDQLVAHRVTNRGWRVGGTKLLPLEILLHPNADDAAVAALLGALELEGPTSRDEPLRYRLHLRQADGSTTEMEGGVGGR